MLKYKLLGMVLSPLLFGAMFWPNTGNVGMQDCASDNVNGTAPLCAIMIGGNGSGTLNPIPATENTFNINVSTATTTQLVAAVSNKAIYITHIHLMAAGTSNVSLVYGTGASCGTGTTTFDGPLPLAAQTGYSAGTGLGAVMILPVNQALCITNGSAVQVGGTVSVSQF